MNSFNILATSDLHGDIRGYKKFAFHAKSDDVNIVLIAGDLTSFDNSNDYDQIVPILRSIKKNVLFIMGNDDEYEWPSCENIININQRSLTINGITFIGYQYTNPFIGGIFEKSESDQSVDFNKLKDLIKGNSILLTHGPCYGILDKPNKVDSVGSKSLLNFVMNYKPRMHIFGHIHECFGNIDNHYNVSYPFSKSFVKIDCFSNTYKIIK